MQNNIFAYIRKVHFIIIILREVYLVCFTTIIADTFRLIWTYICRKNALNLFAIS